MLLLDALASGRLSPAPHATEESMWIAHYCPDAYRPRPDCGARSIYDNWIAPCLVGY